MSKTNKRWALGIVAACVIVYAVAKHKDNQALTDLSGFAFAAS
jgi:hypothetical protein